MSPLGHLLLPSPLFISQLQLLSINQIIGIIILSWQHPCCVHSILCGEQRMRGGKWRQRPVAILRERRRVSVVEGKSKACICKMRLGTAVEGRRRARKSSPGCALNMFYLIWCATGSIRYPPLLWSDYWHLACHMSTILRDRKLMRLLHIPHFCLYTRAYGIASRTEHLF